MATVKQLMSLEGRVSVVTGGATGLGLQMATALAEAGSNIVLCSRKLENCEQAAAQIEKLGVKALAFGCDVTKADQVESLKDAIMQKFNRVDVLVNNAGRAWVAPPEEMPLERWQQVLDLKPTEGYDQRWGSTTGPWTTRDFITAVYQTLRPGGAVFFSLTDGDTQ